MRVSIWIAVVLIFVGLLGILRGGEWVAECAALLLVGLAIVLRDLTWGQAQRDREQP